jgi:hypothetical protein
MPDTLQIYYYLREPLGEEGARRLAEVMSQFYEELARTLTKADWEALQGVLHALAEAQRKTEEQLERLTARVDELAEAQRLLTARVDELAEAQRLLTARVDALAEAQRKTEEQLQRLAHRLEQTNRRIDETNRQLGGLAATVGYTLENEAYRYLPALLERDYGIVLEEPLRRDYLTDRKGQEIEVNILARARRDGLPVLIVGESKVQLSRNDVDRFLKRRVAEIDPAGSRKLFPVIVAHMVTSRDVPEYARSRGVALYLSYEFGR